MKKIGLVLLLGVLVLNLLAEEKIVRLTSLEWPPYSSQTLNQQGASVIVAKAAFMAMGYTLEIDFYPWARAVALAKDSEKYDGYFPEYYDASIAENFYFSDPMGISPLGFAERKNNKIEWQRLIDLKDYRIGTVRGYVNTTEFDNMAANGTLNTDVVVDDLTNLVKLAHGRIDLVVIDRLVLNYLLLTEQRLQQFKNTLSFNEKLLEDKKLYVCFKKNVRGKKLLKIYNEGLKKIKIDALMKTYIESLENGD